MSDYKLKNASMVPPGGFGSENSLGGFGFKEPATGAEFDGRSLSETVRLVIAHRLSNGITRTTEEEAQADVENQICKRIGPEWCRNMNAEKWGFRVDWDTIKAGTSTLAKEALRTLAGKDPWCPQEEAERRAAICAKCFANQRGGECLGCGFMDLVRGVISETCKGVSTKSDSLLQSCQVCSCLLKCKVHYPNDVLSSSMTEKQRNAYADVRDCWMNNL